MRTMLVRTSLILLIAVAVFTPFTGTAQTWCPCLLPNVGGTAELMPAACTAWYLGFMSITVGLPAGSTIDMVAELGSFTNTTEVPGGSYGGDVQTFDAILKLTMTGTGALNGFNRSMQVPATGIAHSAPRTPGDAVQTFTHEIIALNADVLFDPDFCPLRIKAGTANGLPPSVGQSTLTRLGPAGSQFQFDSFFDINYSVEFQGCPGSLLDTLSGTTLGAYRFELCQAPVPVEATSWGTLKSHYDE